MDHPVILYDSSCGLCARSVRFVLRHDKREQFLFAGLDSEPGRAIWDQAFPGTARPDTVVLADEGKLYLKSSAALQIVRRLGPPWSLLYAFILVPRPLRDAVYAWTARRRYRWFGRQDTCTLPDPERKERFLA